MEVAQFHLFPFISLFLYPGTLDVLPMSLLPVTYAAFVWTKSELPAWLADQIWFSILHGECFGYYYNDCHHNIALLFGCVNE